MPVSDVSWVNGAKDSVISHPTPSVWASLSFKGTGQTAWEVTVPTAMCSLQLPSLIMWFIGSLSQRTVLSRLFPFFPPHFYLLSLCAFLLPQRLIWLKEWKGNPSLHSTGHTPFEFPTPPSATITLSGHGKSPRTAELNSSEPRPWSLSCTHYY